eukprot:g2048.t1
MMRRAGILEELCTVGLGMMSIGGVEWMILSRQSRAFRNVVLGTQAVAFLIAYYAVGNHGRRRMGDGTTKNRKESKTKRTSDVPTLETPRSREMRKLMAMPNPFVNRTWVLRPIQRLKIAFNAVTLFPIRLIVMLTCLAINVLLSNCVVFGLSNKDLRTKPLPLWRAKLRDLIAVPLCHVLLWSFGVWRVRKKGVRAKTSEAPTIVAAPHICFLEPLAVMGLHSAMGVSRAENAKIPLFGAITKCMQMILVNRTDPDSKKKTSDALIHRANSAAWNAVAPIALFPEGTTHSQSCLVHFKSGAFRSGKAVQAVVVRMPWIYEDPSWGSGGPSLPSLVFRSMCQFVVRLELEYLPVHPPTAKEIENPGLYAKSTQIRCSQALGVPCTHHSIADVILSNAARKLRRTRKNRQTLVSAVATVELGELEKIIDCDANLAKEYLKRFAAYDKDADGKLSFEEFRVGFQIADIEVAKGLFHLMDTSDSGRIDFKEFLLGVTILNGRGAHDDLRAFRSAVAFAFDAFDVKRAGSIPIARFSELVRRAFPHLTDSEISQFEHEAAADGKRVTKIEFVSFCEKLQQHKEAFRDAHFGSIFVARPPPRRKHNKSKGT